MEVLSGIFQQQNIHLFARKYAFIISLVSPNVMYKLCMYVRTYNVMYANSLSYVQNSLIFNHHVMSKSFEYFVHIYFWTLLLYIHRSTRVHVYDIYFPQLFSIIHVIFSCVCIFILSVQAWQPRASNRINVSEIGRICCKFIGKYRA